MTNRKTTAEVAKELGTTATSITAILWKPQYRHLRPSEKVGRAYLWTQEDIERFRNRERGKGGRPAKKGN